MRLECPAEFPSSHFQQAIWGLLSLAPLSLLVGLTPMPAKSLALSSLPSSYLRYGGQGKMCCTSLFGYCICIVNLSCLIAASLNRTWILILGMSGLIVLFWFVKGGVALRYLVSSHFQLLNHSYQACLQVLFIGVMSCMYVLWDVIGESYSARVTRSLMETFSKTTR